MAGEPPCGPSRSGVGSGGPFERADGTGRRPPEVALLDRESQYVARSRYAERLRPYLRHFDRLRELIGDPLEEWGT